MIDFLQRQPLLALLAAAAVVLVAIIGVETGFGTRLAPRVPAGVARPAAPPEVKLLPPLAAGNADTLYPEMAARPLFVPLRRPAPPAEVAAAGAMKKGQFVLQGVTIAGETRIALLREKTTGKIHRVEKGQDLNGMKLAEVTPESVTLAQGADQEVLPLQVQKPAPASAAQAGPFGGVAPGLGFPAPNPAVPQPGGFAPAVPQPVPAPVPGGPPQADFGPHPPGNPAARPTGEATTAPMSPEELLARRRARRAQQNE